MGQAVVGVGKEVILVVPVASVVVPVVSVVMPVVVMVVEVGWGRRRRRSVSSGSIGGRLASDACLSSKIPPQPFPHGKSFCPLWPDLYV